MKNQTPCGTHLETDERSGHDPGFGLGVFTILLLASFFGLTVFVDSFLSAPTVESVAVSACEFVATLYVGTSFLIAMLALAARFDFRIADKIYLSDAAKKFASGSHSVSFWIDGFIHALVFSILAANGHTNTAGFFLFAMLALLGCAWLMSNETRKYVSSIPERG